MIIFISIFLISLISIENKYGESIESEKDLFDYLSLLINVVAILITWLITRHYYKKEIKRLEQEEREITRLQIDQFNFHLEILKDSIKRQISDLNPQKINKTDRITNRQSINSRFLDFININTIAKHIHRNEPEKLEDFRQIVFNIGLLSNLSNNIKEIVESYNYRLVRFEDGFYNYKHLLYKEFIELAKERNISQEPTIIKFKTEDEFIIKYTKLRDNTLNNNEIIKDNILIDRRKLITEFIIPFLQLSSDFFLIEAKANYLNQIANTCKTSFEEIEKLRTIKAQKVEAQRKILIRVYRVLQNRTVKNYP